MTIEEETMGGTILLIFVFIIYFVPTIVAYNRNHRQAMAIMVLNFFGGWTAIGWVVALVWACTADVLSEEGHPMGNVHSTTLQAIVADTTAADFARQAARVELARRDKQREVARKTEGWVWTLGPIFGGVYGYFS
jgi:hypothetical protein